MSWTGGRTGAVAGRAPGLVGHPVQSPTSRRSQDPGSSWPPLQGGRLLGYRALVLPIPARALFYSVVTSQVGIQIPHGPKGQPMPAGVARWSSLVPG